MIVERNAIDFRTDMIGDGQLTITGDLGELEVYFSEHFITFENKEAMASFISEMMVWGQEVLAKIGNAK